MMIFFLAFMVGLGLHFGFPWWLWVLSAFAVLESTLGWMQFRKFRDRLE
jgi:hypothetical protein